MLPKPTVRGEYIETETGNKISRRASILGPKHITLAGKCVIQHDVIVHGDLVRSAAAASSVRPKPSESTNDKKTTTSTTTTALQDSISIQLGRYVFVSPHVTLHPPSRISTSETNSTTPQLTYYPLRISDHVYIGPHTHIQAATIGTHVHIGANCTVGNFVFIKDNVRVEDNTILPPHSVWPSGTVVAGRPGRVVGEIGDGWAVENLAGGAEGNRKRWESVENHKKV